MNLDALALEAFAAMLMVKPSLKSACAKARRVNGEIRLHRFPRHSRCFNHARQDRFQIRILKGIQNGIETRSFFNQTALLRFAQIRGETSRREAAINLKAAQNTASASDTRGRPLV
ncbi:MAG: hypothetical protein DMG12_24495 [Acidobacteria bacterium]|nr:MAG: hypothetical protein DMG12_24495 [Acidobacteriota bacterium]